ncbi:MAG TPA: hypothetical protein VIJ19_01220 [Opitutaceae bacterium]
MNERPDPKSRLIADLFHEDWDSGSASRLALEAAAQVRRRRVLRRGAIAATLSTCALLLAVMVARGSSRSVLKPAIESSPERVPVPLAVQTHKGYEIISDDELIADLKDRPLLVLGDLKTGRQLIVIQSDQVTASR